LDAPWGLEGVVSLENTLYSFVGMLLQPYFEKNVRMRLTLPKWGLGSPPGLPKVQNLIAKVKKPGIEHSLYH
jgi:hypothetical protein